MTSADLPRWCTLVRCDNPGPMTLEGTNTYVLQGPGAPEAVVIDPGPLDEGHLATVAGLAPVGLVLLTHGHPDHAEGAHLFQDLTGASVAAADARLSSGFEPLADGQTISVGGVTVRVVTTPGHTTDSVCFVVEDDEAAVLTGDTVLGRGTTVVAHPDGRLGDYLHSLRRVADLGPLRLLPGHGPVRDDAAALATEYLDHRQARLEQVAAAVAGGATTAPDVVQVVYADVDPALWPAAELSVRAQLDYLDTASAGASGKALDVEDDDGAPLET